jgi:ABC-type multidrug transport system ATPase subunit
VLIDDIDLDKNRSEAKQRFGLVPDTPTFLANSGQTIPELVADVYRCLPQPDTS